MPQVEQRDEYELPPMDFSRDQVDLPPMDFTRDQMAAKPMSFNMFEAKGGRQPEVVGDEDPRVQAIRTKRIAMAALEKQRAIADGMRYMDEGGTTPGEGLIPYGKIMKDLPPGILPEGRVPVGLDPAVFNKYLKPR